MLFTYVFILFENIIARIPSFSYDKLILHIRISILRIPEEIHACCGLFICILYCNRDDLIDS